jgi:uncharacterized ion transporter superfamily protein YfcC
MNYYQFMDKADAWTEQEGWLGWIITYYHKLTFDRTLILILYILVFVLFIWGIRKVEKGE